VVGDLSLRAALRARGAPVAAAVLDAEQLPLRPAAVDTLVAAHLVNLLERPARFFTGAARALARRGRLALSTPAPDRLDDALAEAGFDVCDSRDPVPWVHVHRPRHVQIYSCRAVVAVKARSR